MHIDYPNTSPTDTSDHSDHTATAHNLPPSSSSCESSSEEGDNSVSSSLPPDATHDKLEYTSGEQHKPLIQALSEARPRAPDISPSDIYMWQNLVKG